MENYNQDYTDRNDLNEESTDRKYPNQDDYLKHDYTNQENSGSEHSNDQYTSQNYSSTQNYSSNQDYPSNQEYRNPFFSDENPSNNADSNYTGYNNGNGSDYSGYNYQNNGNGQDYSSYGYTSQSYNQSAGQGYSDQEYMDLENEKRTLESEVESLESQRGIFRVTTVVFAILFVLSLGYIIYSEVDQPLFGKWPQVAAENIKLQEQVADLSLLQLKIDSLVTVNNILVEHSDRQDGLFFEVQIGAFEHFNMEQYMESLARLKKERVDVLDKYTMGKFRDFKTAEAFSNDIKRMGIADAFIVAKMDGQRVDLPEAVKASKKKIY